MKMCIYIDRKQRQLSLRNKIELKQKKKFSLTKEQNENAVCHSHFAFQPIVKLKRINK